MPDLLSPALFRSAVACICSGADIRRMLHDTLHFLSAFLPVDALALSRFEMDRGAVHRLALCHRDGSEEGESLEKIPDEVLEFACGIIRSRRRYVLTCSCADNPVRAYMHDCGRSRFQSAVVLHLYVDDRYLGSVDVFSEKPRAFSAEDARMLDQLAMPFTLFLNEHLHGTDRPAPARRASEPALVTGMSASFAAACRLARDVAATITPVLITGETGSGKEVMADFIQQASDRAHRPFIKVNCAAIPASLMENEFFGHEAHAFTGAGRVQKGRFERADGGTLFLDEIGELPAEAQSKLLRVLEHKQVERLGGSSPIRIDVRIIAATNRDLERLVREGSFRQDLYYRLNVFPIALPPLRDRKEDIPALVRFLLQKKQRELDLPMLLEPSQEELSLLMEHDWPGNVRELSNVVERALILAQRTGRLHFQPEAHPAPLPGKSADVVPAALLSFNDASPVLPLRDMERACILHALRRTNGRLMGRNGAAELLGINGYTLRSRMVKLGLLPAGKRSGGNGS